MINDLTFAFRQLRKNPVFSAIAILSLALGIGANTAIFSLVNEFLLRSLAVKAPEELVLFRHMNGAKDGGRMARSTSGNSYMDPVTGLHTGTSFSLLIFERFREHGQGLSHVFAYAPLRRSTVLIEGQPEISVFTQLVSGDYYAGLGVTAAVGRTLTKEDDRPSAGAVAVLSHRHWQNRFAGDPGVIGRTLQINRVPVTIVGVSAAGFEGTSQVGESADISLPLSHLMRFQSDASNLQPWSWWLRIMGRVAPGTTAEQARANLEPLMQRAALEGWEAGRSMDRTPQNTPPMSTLVADPGGQGENDTRRYHAKSMYLLMGLVGLVLLAACANVANLLLARGAARRREIGVRLALGASRSRLIRQLLAESLLLALLGAALGTALAWWGRGVLMALRPFGNATMTLDLPLDARVLGFTITVAVATAVLFGLAPALRATRLDLCAEFQGGTRALGSGGRSRLAQTLMVVQIALSLVLLVSTALFVRTLQNLQKTNAGFNRSQLVQFRVELEPAGYTAEQQPAMQLRIVEQLRKIPGVSDATFTSIPLLNRGAWSSSVGLPGSAQPSGSPINANFNTVAPNFFSVLELPLVLGRPFTERDAPGAPKVAVVNQAFVKKYLPEENPIGRIMTTGRNGETKIEIIGVARDAKYTTLREAVPPTIYQPALQEVRGGASYLVRASGDMVVVLPALRAAVRELDPALPVVSLRPLDEQMDLNHAQERLFARLSGFFGLLALALACVGLYGLMSYSVLRRTGEIGLRMALGALPGHVLRMILKESLALVCLGVVLGLTGAYFASRLIASMLYGLSATDPFTYALAACILIAIAVVAALLPAHHASRINPMTALRSEDSASSGG